MDLGCDGLQIYFFRIMGIDIGDGIQNLLSGSCGELRHLCPLLPRIVVSAQ